MDMVTGIWDAAVVAIITDGAEAAGITMDGHAADTADGINVRDKWPADFDGFEIANLSTFRSGDGACPRLKRSDWNLINPKIMPFVRNRTQLKTLSSDSTDVRPLVADRIDQTWLSNTSGK
jgi:hypothetical protein